METFWFTVERFNMERLFLVSAVFYETQSFVAAANTRGLSFSPVYDLMDTTANYDMGLNVS